MWKAPSSPKKILSPNFNEPPRFFQRYTLAKTGKRNMDARYPQIPCDISFCGSCTQTYTFCFKMLVLVHLHRPVLTQQVQNLGHLAFKGRPSSPNFCEKSPNSVCKMNHTHPTINIYIYREASFRHVYMNCRQNFSPFAISGKFSRDCNCSWHTQRLTQRKPLSWTFCSTLTSINNIP